MAEKNLSENLQSITLQTALTYLDKDPDKNIPKLLAWVEKFDRGQNFQSQIKAFHNVIDHPGNNWYQLIKSMWTDLDSDVRKCFFKNFIIHANVIGGRRQDRAREKFQCNIPWAILLDPTSACNLHCIGCWAAQYGHQLSMDYNTLDDIIRQGKEFGTYIYIYSGGEPLMRKKDLIRLCEKHTDCVFLAFTNGTLIDEEFANEMLRVKNFIPAISVEGFEEETDMRRGKGTYRQVIRAMDLLREKKLAFGFSACYHSKNTESMGSEEFIDFMIEKGNKFGWFFTYMPVGVDAVQELMASAEQREYMYRQIRRFRETKPLFTMDFWNDGEYTRGCIAGGRMYLHISAGGEIEPCAFIHYSDSNIREKSLIEAFQSPLFMQYRQNQPFSDNHLRPCPLLDNPEKLSQMVDRSKARSTDLTHPEDVHDLSAKCVEKAGEWKVAADRLWEERLCEKATATQSLCNEEKKEA